MRKYVYRVEKILANDQAELEDVLDSFGRQGWELCAVDGVNFYFKKETGVIV